MSTNGTMPSEDGVRLSQIKDVTYERRLFNFSMDLHDRELHFLAFRGLQGANFIQLQNSLSKCKKKTLQDHEYTEEHSVQMKQLLHDYANAVRDYQYMIKLLPITGSQARDERLNLEHAFPEIGTITDDPGGYRRLSSESVIPTDPLRDFLKQRLPLSVTYTKGEMERRFDEYLMRKPAVEVSPVVDRLARFIVAFLGGSSLVVPMLIMRLPDVTLAKSLITVSVAVLLFAVALSILFRASNTDTMAATATYAAVLVVFVGTSS